MSDNTAAAASAPAKKAAKPKKPADHPPVAEMVNSAITDLKDKKGSSLAAIKKHVAAHHKVDMDRIAPFIRRYLKKAVTDGKLTQTKGTGASGSFKLAKKVEEKKPKPAAKKPKVAKKPAKKVKTPKKVTKKPAAKKDAKKTPKKAAKKSPKKEKKAKAAAKPKKPKAKTAKTPKKAAKKPAAKKTAKK